MKDDNRFARHEGHDVSVVTYASTGWALECADCYEVIIDQEVWEMM